MSSGATPSSSHPAAGCPSACAAKAGIELVAVDTDQAHVARTAFRLYGKRRHPAGLNFGDCFAYALARTLDEPLLFKGTDFSLTDVEMYSKEQDAESG